MKGLICNASPKKYFGLACALFLIGTIVLSYMGYHLSAKRAAVNTGFINENAIVLGETNTKYYHILFYENADTYETIVLERKLFLWKAIVGFSGHKDSAPLVISGGCSFGDSNKGVTTISVLCNDDKVAYINIDADGKKIRKDVSVNKNPIFTWDCGIGRDNIFGEAYDKNDVLLYRTSTFEQDNRNKRWITWIRD